MDKTRQPGINIAQIFLDKVEFRHRPDYLSKSPSDVPEVGDITLRMRFLPSEETPELSGVIQVRAQTQAENDPDYELDVTMSAIIERQSDEQNMTLTEYVVPNGYAMMHPFLRQAIADLTMRGRFGPVWLSPINFRALFDQAGTARKKKVVSKRKSPRK